MPAPDDSTNRRLDVVVIGAGPAGEAAALLAANLGYSVALVERDTVGGTVVTNGGAPTKTFREAALYLSSWRSSASARPCCTARQRSRTPPGWSTTPPPTPTATGSYGYRLAAADSLNRLDPAVLQAMLLPSRAHITRGR